MKRSLLAVLGILFSLALKAQDIELLGEYQAFFIGAETIDFVGRDSFYFNGFYCTNGVTGKGRCEIKDGYLYLYFEKSKVKNPSDGIPEPVISVSKNTGSEKTVELSCLIVEGRSISFASINIITGKQEVQHYTTDSAGHLTFRVDETDFPLTIQSSAIGFQRREFKLTAAASYVVKLFHGEVDIPIKPLNKGQLFVYEIKELSPDKIVMRRPVGKGQFYEYKKVHQ